MTAKSGSAKTDTYHWRAVIEPWIGEDRRMWIRRAWRPYKWRWARERSYDGARWWVDAEGGSETIHAACRKAMKGWNLWALDTRRMEVQYAIEKKAYQSTPSVPGRARMELLDG